MTSRVKIDEIDAKILKALLRDARTSFSDIARDCSTSTNAIVKRFYRLKRTGVIAGTSLIMDTEEFGYKFAVSIGINVDAGEEIHLVEALNRVLIFGCSQQVGKLDVHGSTIAKNLEDLDEIRNMIKRQKGVRRVRITANIDKRVFFPENLLIQPTGTCKNG